MPHFDLTVSLGNLLTVGVVVGAWITFISRSNVLLSLHQDLITKLEDRFALHERHDDERFVDIQDRIIDLIRGIERMAGQQDFFRVQPRPK